MTSREYELYVTPIERRIVNSVWRIVRDPSAVEDLVRDVIEQVVRKVRRVRAHQNPHALILRMAVQRALDFARSRARRQSAKENFQRAEKVRLSSGACGGGIELREELDVVLGMLHQLPKREAEALWLHAVEEMSYAEAATSMGCRPATVRVLAVRARKRLKWYSSNSTYPDAKEDNDPCEKI